MAGTVSCADLKRPEARSRITNGQLFFHHVDRRSITARRLRDLIAIYGEPFGGLSEADEPTRQLIRRAAMLTVQSELLETKSAAGEEVNPITYVTIANTLARALRALEAKGPAKPDHTPTAADALAQIAAEAGEP